MVNGERPNILIFPTLEKACEALAKRIAALSSETVAHQTTFSLALSGGRTPGYLYQILGERYTSLIDWNAVHLFWGDERVVPLDHKDSNYALVEKTLIRKVIIPRSNIHPMPVNIRPLSKAAEDYEKTLREFFEREKTNRTISTFDVQILGLGEDGHTASLFPGSPALEEDHRWVLPIQSPVSGSLRKRLTVTLPMINKARYTFFLVSGERKRKILRTILKENRRDRNLYPAWRVQPRQNLYWYLDRTAAGSLSK
jgi:6-phosphogluconolactonase